MRFSKKGEAINTFIYYIIGILFFVGLLFAIRYLIKFVSAGN